MSDQNVPPILPQPPGAGDIAAGTRLSKCALWSLITGILSLLGLFLFTALPAIILGIVGIVQVGKGDGQLHGKGLAISGLVMGCVSLVVVPMLLALSLPAYNGIRQSGFKVKNMSSMKQIVIACQIYAEDNEGKFPADLEALVPDYLDIPEVLHYHDPSDSANVLPFRYFPGYGQSDTDALLLAAPPSLPRRKRRGLRIRCRRHDSRVGISVPRPVVGSTRCPKTNP